MSDYKISLIFKEFCGFQVELVILKSYQTRFGKVNKS